MKYIKFNKTICGVDFLLNVIDLQCDIKVDEPGETQSADFFQVYFIKNADGYLKLNDRTIELKPDSLIFISQNQHHSWHGGYSKMEGQVLVFQDEFLNDFFSDQYFIFRLLYFYQTNYPLVLNVETDFLNDYLLKLKEIKRELVNPRNDSVHIIRSLLYYILITTNRNYSDTNQLGEAIALDNTAYQFRKLVERHIYTNQRVEDYSDMMKISRISLNKAVKSQFNVTATEFIKSRILFEIQMRLIHTAKTVAEIAYELNFSEANHMSRFFKQKTGKSPIEYREESLKS